MFQNATPDNDWEGSTGIHSRWVLTTQSSFTHAHTIDAANINTTEEWNESARNYDSLVIWSCVVEPITILGLLGNGSIFWFLCCRIKRTKYTVYVLNLSMADFTILICHNCWFLSQFITWSDKTSEKYVFIVVDILSVFGYNTSLFLLTAISVERCLGAFFPLWYHFSRPKHISGILCALLWILSCAATALEYFIAWSAILEEAPCGNHMAACIILTTLCLIFIPVMVFCSISLFIKIRRKSQPMSSARLYISIVTTVILFLVLVVPFRLLCLIIYWHAITELEWDLFNFSFFLHIINSSLNPFVYFLVGRQKRHRSYKSLYGVIYRSCKDEPEVLPQEHLGNEQVG